VCLTNNTRSVQQKDKKKKHIQKAKQREQSNPFNQNGYLDKTLMIIYVW
jgi:hypothetical protein